jgi:hypothetical protein
MNNDLWYISKAECRNELLKCENYGYGLDIRRIKKGLKVIDTTVERHKNEYDFWLDLYVYKLLRGEGYHPPLYLIEPRWEYEQMYDWWTCYFSYSWKGAKQDEKNSR